MPIPDSLSACLRGCIVKTGPRNLLEPPAFAGLFRACPPEGFVVSPRSDLSIFRAEYDLLTTTAGDMPALLRRPAAFARRTGLSRVRAAFVGSTVTEYAVLPRESAPEAIADAVLQEPAGRDCITVIKDLPDASPLLDAEDNAFADALERAARARGFFTLWGQALAYVPIDFSSTDEYLSRLSASRRKDLRRKLKRSPRPDPEIIACGDPRCSDPAFVDEIYTLYRAVFDQSTVHFDLLSRDFFASLLQSRDAGALLFLYRHKGKTAGWNLCLAHNGLLIDKYIGFRYPAARELNLYFLSWLFNLEYAVNNGFRTYIAGWTDPEVKAGLGASFTFTRHSVLVHNPLLRAALYPLRRFFEADRASLQHSTLETVACRQAPPALLPLRGKDLPRKSLQSGALISFANCSGPFRKNASGQKREIRNTPAPAFGALPVLDSAVPLLPLVLDSAPLPPLVLDFDASVLPLGPDERRIPLETWRERIGFGCTRRDFARLEAFLDHAVHEAHGPVFLGSGDFHHVSLALLRRLIRANAPAPASLDLVILDNHPDNMLYPFGVHCGSWAGRAAALEAVRHVHVAGITSPDIGLLHAWENDCRPFLRKKLTWWSLGRRAPLPALIAGKEHARCFRTVDALLAAFLPRLRDMENVYLSVDKDVLHPDAAYSGWDQGLFRPEHVEAVAACCAGRVVGVDVCGDHAVRSYRSIGKRLLCRLDGLADAPPADERSIRERGRAVNLKILEALR